MTALRSCPLLGFILALALVPLYAQNGGHLTTRPGSRGNGFNGWSRRRSGARHIQRPPTAIAKRHDSRSAAGSSAAGALAMRLGTADSPAHPMASCVADLKIRQERIY